MENVLILKTLMIAIPFLLVSTALVFIISEGGISGFLDIKREFAFVWAVILSSLIVLAASILFLNGVLPNLGEPYNTLTVTCFSATTMIFCLVRIFNPFFRKVLLHD